MNKHSIGSELTVAVVMTVWRGSNPEQFAEAIESIRWQTRSPDQFIIVCDGTLTDDLEAVLEADHSKKKIIVERLKENGGQGPALNHGVSQVTTDLIAIMDSDDISRPYRLEKQLALFENDAGDIIGGGIEEFTQKPGDLGHFRTVPTDPETMRKWIAYRTPFNHVTIMLRKALFQKIGGYKALTHTLDWDLAVRAMATEARLLNIADVLVDVRVNPKRSYDKGYLQEEMVVLNGAYRQGVIGLKDWFLSQLIRRIRRLTPMWLIGPAYRVLLRKR